MLNKKFYFVGPNGAEVYDLESQTSNEIAELENLSETIMFMLP